MKHLLQLTCVVSTLSSSAFAQAAPPPAAPAPKAAPAPAATPAAPAPPGPSARKPANEAAVKREVEAFFKAEDAIVKARAWDAMLARVEFPVLVTTDDQRGRVTSEAWPRDRYLAEMQPMWEGFPPGASTQHRLTTTVLSDSLVSVIDDYTVTAPRAPLTRGRNASLLVRVNGQWKYKAMTEAGWGDLPSAPTVPAAVAPAPTPPAPARPATSSAPPPAPSPAAAPPPPGGATTAAPAPRR